jgi:hypothetical protein
MATPHPVTVEVTQPERYSREQLALRVVLFILFGLVGISFGAVFFAFYLALPAFAAIALSNEGPEQFRTATAPGVTRLFRWVLSVYAFFALIIDRLPTREPETDVFLEVHPTGNPTVGTALLRILTGIPSAIVLAILMFVSAILWVVAFILVLITRDYPRALFDFQLGVLRWIARLFAYQASLVEEYPPFALTEAPHGPPMRASGV